MRDWEKENLQSNILLRLIHIGTAYKDAHVYIQTHKIALLSLAIKYQSLSLDNEELFKVSVSLYQEVLSEDQGYGAIYHPRAYTEYL